MKEVDKSLMKSNLIGFLFLFIIQSLCASDHLHDNGCLKAALKASTSEVEHEADLINPYFMASSIGKNLKGKFEVKNFFDEMRKCMVTMPDRASKEIELLQIFKKMGISNDFSVTAYVESAGEKEVNWENLPPEMSLNSASEVLNPLFFKGNGNLFLKYFKITTPKNSEEEIEGSFYYFNTVNKMNKDVITKKKGPFKTTWNEENAIAKMELFNLLLGLQCLYPDSHIETEQNSLKFIYKGPTSYGYFILSNILKKNQRQAK